MPVVRRDSARSISFYNRKIIAFVIVFSLLIGFLVLPKEWTPFIPSVGAAGTVLSSWGFEGVTTTNTGSTPTVSVGSAAADSGALTVGSAFAAFHASASTVWSNPAGNASAKSVSSDHWGVGDYYQFSFS